MHRETAISALRRGMPLAAELACADPLRRAWIGVYPLDLSHESTREFLRNAGVHIIPTAGRAYHVRTFEVDKALNEKDVWIGETELINRNSYFAFSEEDLIKQLKRLGISLESLGPHHKSDYPI
jgi:hypothetical protein